MKKTLMVIAIVAVTALVLAGCSGKKDTSSNSITSGGGQSVSVGGGGTSLADLNDSNWQAVIKANFGIDLAVPAGWTFKEVYSPNKVNNLKLFLTIGEGTTGKEEGKRLFDTTKALSPHGNYKNDVNWEAETVSAGDVVNDFAEVDTFRDDDVNASWSYTFNSNQIMVNYYAITGRQAEYTFTIRGNL